jgi:hypothetical protein
MQFITVRRFIVNASRIMSIEGYRPRNGSDVKTQGLSTRLGSQIQETKTSIGPLMPTGGMPIPLQGDND